MRRTWETYYQPGTLDDALGLLAEHGARARVIAGGTDVIVELSRNVKPTATLIDITRIPELRGIHPEGHELILGALTTHNDVIASPLLVTHALPLAQACHEIGAPQLRTRATVAGNLITASPANDTISALMALDARVVLVSTAGTRTLPVSDFLTGFRTTALRADELVREIRIPAMTANQRGLFIKLGLRRAQAISVIHIAMVLTFDDDIVTDARIALGCLAPTIVRGHAIERAVTGHQLTPDICAHAGTLARNDVTPIDDIRGSAGYRQATLARLVTDGLQRLAGGREREGWPEHPILLDTGTTSIDSTTGPEPVTSARATVNGRVVNFGPHAVRATLLDAVREETGLTGSKEGCAEGECGACTMWLDGQAVMSCLVPAAQATGRSVTTIEGLQDGDRLHPLQQAFIDEGAVQCGFCIPGMLMAGARLLDERLHPSTAETLTALSGNICRCTGYRKIIAAVDRAAREPATP